MIRYALSCDGGHAFESWFRSSEAYDDQAQRGLLACPVCGSGSIAKQIMAPAVAVKDEPPVAAPVPVMRGMDAEARAMLRALRKRLEENAENVGTAFAEEARKIHFGETEERAIYGVATPEEARTLNDEGIEVVAIPVVPDELN